jgi:hypothetical protein
MRRSVAILLVVALAGCRGHDRVTGTVFWGTPVTLSALWPNDDGHRWDYRLRQQTWDDSESWVVASPDSAPPAPGLDAVIDALARNVPGIIHTPAESTHYALQFRGMMTTLSGVTAQHLVETLGSDTLSLAGDGFAATLARARPDLAPALARYAGARASQGSFFRPNLLHGYAWRKSRDWIGGYGDVDQLLAWKFLQADLTPGSGFTFQLVPSLATDVFLHARVIRQRQNVRVGSRMADVIDVAYLIDFGILRYVAGADSTLGYARNVNYGYVTYAAGVGPVASVERFMASVNPTARDSLSAGWGEQRLTWTGIVPALAWEPAR